MPMQKREKIWVRRVGVVMGVVIEARWAMVWRMSWAMRSVGRDVWRASMMRAEDWAAWMRAW